MATFTKKFTADTKHRIVLPPAIIEAEELHEGDMMEITVRKINKGKD